VPADDGLGSDEDEMPAPVAPDQADQDLEESVAGTEAEPLPGRPTQDGELLAEKEVLGDQVGASADEDEGHGDEQGEELDHAAP
jgi:hypothetical protein